jgi:hypothetical protein
VSDFGCQEGELINPETRPLTPSVSDNVLLEKMDPGPNTQYPVPNTQYQMSNPSTRPRILFVTPEVAFVPERESSRINFIGADERRFNSFPAKLISELFELGVDVHAAQPDFRNIFTNRSQHEKPTYA